MSVTAHYVLLASDTETVTGEIAPAYEVALGRLQRSEWAIYRRTPNRSRIQQDDRVVIYAAGVRERGGTFVGSATVSSISPPARKAATGDAHLLIDMPIAIISLRDVKVFSNPPSIYAIKEQLKFIPGHSRWGSVLQGGCRYIEKPDYVTIIANAGKL